MTGKFSDTRPYIFSDFCSVYKKFLVPPFQRSYAWSSKQINDLWESIVSNEKEYFVGNIVCLEATEESDNRVVIIDGQQRLFTITLMLSVIRDEYGFIKYKDKKEKEKERIWESQQNIDDILFHKEISFPFRRKLRFFPGRRNLKDVYEKLIKGELNVDDRSQISLLDDNQIKYVKNYKTIRRLVKQYVKTDYFKQLDNLLEKVTSLLFIVILCKTDNDAYSIFEGLNATGIGLTVADLVKNAVLQAVKSESAKNSVEENWEQIENIFEETRISLFPKFLRHQWISREGYVTSSKLYGSIKKNKLQNKENMEIIDYTKELLDDAKIYSSFRFEQNASYLLKHTKITEGIINIIKRFRYLDLEQVYELILAYYNKFISTERYTEKQLYSVLENLWTFSFRAKIININPSEYEKKFADHCKHISGYTKKEMDRMSIGFYAELAKLVDNDTEFIENFVTDIKYKEGSDNSLIIHLLETMMRNEDPSIKVAEPTIEHILPRDPCKWGLKRNEVKDFVNAIGNLTLLNDSDNKTLGNEKMSIKVQKVFGRSAFKMNRELSKKQHEFEKNPKEAIKARSY